MINSVYLYSVYVDVVKSVSYPEQCRLLLKAIVHVFFIFNESVLAVIQSGSFLFQCIILFQYVQIFPFDKGVRIICIHNKKGDLRHTTQIIYIHKK